MTASTAELCGSPPNQSNRVIDRPLEAVQRTFGLFQAQDLLRKLQDQKIDFWMVGGAVRDLAIGGTKPLDIDLVVPNQSAALHHVLKGYGTQSRNRHGNYRYELVCGTHVDVIEPRFFYGNFTTISETVEFFDASVNAIAISCTTGDLVDPLGGLEDIRKRRIQLPVGRWSSMSDFESVHLALRLSRLVKRFDLTVINPKMLAEQVSKFETVDWVDLKRLHGFGLGEGLNRVRYVLSQSGHN
ncbi:hypothetical protein [Rhodococcoides fascians]|uniref:hypothetical protein n=1 Tax=Rhodococcoides fascians TaxID=1828 RepID=UPI00050BF289|nr:hypothetical protein [Rhodococcus fascians]